MTIETGSEFQNLMDLTVQKHFRIADLANGTESLHEFPLVNDKDEKEKLWSEEKLWSVTDLCLPSYYVVLAV